MDPGHHPSFLCRFEPTTLISALSASQATLASYEQLGLGYLAVVRKEDGALCGRCGLMELVVESVAPEHGIRRGWFRRPEGCGRSR